MEMSKIAAVEWTILHGEYAQAAEVADVVLRNTVP